MPFRMTGKVKIPTLSQNRDKDVNKVKIPTLSQKPRFRMSTKSKSPPCRKNRDKDGATLIAFRRFRLCLQCRDLSL